MDQALYEIFARIREMYKAAVSVLNDTIDNTDSQFVKLIYAYAVLKGCRMKLIQTEKYASKAEDCLLYTSQQLLQYSHTGQVHGLIHFRTL